MRLLRLVAALVGGTLQRLGRVLLSWAAVESRQDADQIGDQHGGPPEHLVRYLRERAPWLLIGDRPLPTRGAPRLHPAPAGGAPAASTVSAMPRSQPDAGASSHRNADPVQPRATQARVPLRRAEPDHTVRQPAEPTMQKRIDSPATQRAAVPLVRPLNAEWRPTPIAEARPLSSRESTRRADQPDATPRSTETRWRESSTPAVTHSAPMVDLWVSLPAPVFRVDAVAERDNAAPTVAVDDEARPESRQRPSVFEPTPDRGIRFLQPLPAPGDAADVGHWATLPDRGFEEWEVQSTRLLLREQLHLIRLLAEQAGSSWSAPLS